MKKLTYIGFLFLMACGNEPESKNGKIVQQEKENSNEVSENPVPDNDSALVENPESSKVVLRSGTTIEYLSKGSGNTLKKGEMVRVKYKTFLPTGKIIDGSDLIGMPLPYYIGINMSVKGWDEAFQHLRVGDKVKLHLPSEMAYGKKGFGAMVPPDTDLDFEIEITEKIEMKKTASGIQYFFLVRNEEAKQATDGKKVDVHYYGWTFKDAKMFDTSHNSGSPHRFIVGQGEEILAWEEMIKLMNKGDKIIMFVPSKLAYAEKGVPELVPANADLVYIFELMNVL